jgi:DNA-binding transcriptional MocR family regulator
MNLERHGERIRTDAIIDLSGRQPPWPRKTIAAWNLCHERAARDADVWATPSRTGDARLRRALALSIGADERALIVTAGVRACAQSMGGAGGRYYLERPGFADVPRVLSIAGADVVLCTWDNMAAASTPPPGQPVTSWVTSPARNPDGAALAATDRAHLQSRLKRGDRVVVNEIYRWYGSRPDVVPGATRVGSLSKVAGGGARLGWMVRAHPSDEAMVTHHWAMPPALWQRAWAYFIEETGLAPLIHANVHAAQRARDAFRSEAASWLPPSVLHAEGPSLLIPFPSLSEGELEAALLGLGIKAGLGSDFLCQETAVRVCFSAASEDEAATAARRMAQLRAG